MLDNSFYQYMPPRPKDEHCCKHVHHNVIPHKQNMPYYKSVDIKETCKVAEITDAFNVLRYKVEMVSYDVVNDGKYLLVYQVQVVNYFSGPEPLIVFEAPDIDLPPIYDINVASKIYDDCIKNYSSLVKAETRDYQDIDVYKEKIEYTITHPKCCATCKWCKIFGPCHSHFMHGQMRDYPHEDYINMFFGRKSYCTNPENCVIYRTDLRHPPVIDHHRLEFEDRFGHKELEHDNTILKITPKVDPLGVCKNYEEFENYKN